MEEKILAYLDEHQQELYDLLSELLKIDTQNYHTYGLEEAGQQYFAEVCRKDGFEADLYYPDAIPGFTEHEGYLPNRGTDKRPNVTVPYRGKTGKKKITIAAHMDTVPLGDESQWSVPPLSGAIKDGRIYGRGGSDDKFGIVAGLYALKALRACGVELNNDVYVTSYCDEEGGGGNGALATALKYPSDIYINLDGGKMEVQPYAVGGAAGRIAFHSEEELCSSRKMFAGFEAIVEEFDKFGNRRLAELDQSPIFHGTGEAKDAYRLLSIKCGNGGLNLNYGELGYTIYTLLDQEQFEQEFKEMGEAIDKRLKELDLVFDGIIRTSRYFHAVAPKSSPAEAQMFCDLLSQTNGKPSRIAGSCLSDLSVLHRWGGGIAFNSGLYKGFDEYGGPHQIDEYVTCSEFLAITKALALFLLKQDEE